MSYRNYYSSVSWWHTHCHRCLPTFNQTTWLTVIVFFVVKRISQMLHTHHIITTFIPRQSLDIGSKKIIHRTIGFVCTHENNDNFLAYKIILRFQATFIHDISVTRNTTPPIVYSQHSQTLIQCHPIEYKPGRIIIFKRNKPSSVKCTIQISYKFEIIRHPKIRNKIIPLIDLHA